MSEVPYESPRITDLSPKQVFNCPDTAISREGLRAQARQNKQDPQAGDKIVPKPNIKAIKTLQQMFPGPDNTKMIDRLRPEDEKFTSILNPN